MSVSRSGRPIKRSFNIAGHPTSISLEAPFWEALKDVAARASLPMVELVAHIDAGRAEAGLSSAVRVWLLDYYKSAASRRGD